MAKIVLTLTAGLLCLAAASWLGYSAWSRGFAESTAPGFLPDRRAHDFGIVGQQEGLTATFRLTNSLPQAVSVSALMKTCGCAKTEISTEQIAPGGYAELTVHWDTRGRRGKSDEVITVLYVAGDETKVVGVQVKADVTPTFTWEPAVLTFRHSANESVSVAVRQPAGGDARLTAAATDDPAVSVALTADRSGVTITHRPRAEPPTGVVDAWVTVGTTSPSEPTIRIPVRLTP